MQYFCINKVHTGKGKKISLFTALDTKRVSLRGSVDLS